MAWFTGMHTLFLFNTIQSGQGIGNEFVYIIAAVVGGCLLTGGYGSAVGAAIGALIFGMVNQGIVYAGWNPDWFQFFVGAAAARRDPAEHLHPSPCGGIDMSTPQDTPTGKHHAPEHAPPAGQRQERRAAGPPGQRRETLRRGDRAARHQHGGGRRRGHLRAG